MPRKRPRTADDPLRALRREAAAVASDLARKLQDAPPEIEVFAPLVVAAFRHRNRLVVTEIDENQGRYEGRAETWFRLMRQVRDHPAWGPQLFESLRPPAPPP